MRDCRARPARPGRPCPTLALYGAYQGVSHWPPMPHACPVWGMGMGHGAYQGVSHWPPCVVYKCMTRVTGPIYDSNHYVTGPIYDSNHYVSTQGDTAEDGPYGMWYPCIGPLKMACMVCD